FVNRKCASVAGRMVGQHVPFRMLLKDVEKVAAETIESWIVGCHPRNRRIDCGSLKLVLDRFVRCRRSRKSDRDEVLPRGRVGIGNKGFRISMRMIVESCWFASYTVDSHR